MAVQEILLQFFLMEAGKFQFLNVVVEAEGHSVPCQAIVLDLARQVDEWQNLVKSKAPLDHIVVSRVPEKSLEKVPYPARHVLEAATNRTVARIVEAVPIYSFKALTIISQVLSKNLLELKAPGGDTVTEKGATSQEALLRSFKKAYGHILEPRGEETKIDRLVSFCKYYFDKTAVFTVRDEHLVRCVSHTKKASGGIVESDDRELNVPIDKSLIFAGVNRSGVAFFGKIDFSKMLREILDLPPSGECALILVERRSKETLFLFALSAREPGSAFQYLKFFSEMMKSPENSEYGNQPISVSERATRMVSEIDDIPSMSQIVSRVLQILSDPEKSIKDLEAVLSEDQAMVARIIRVSNSALYRSVQEARNLGSALTRLGLKAIRSILLSSATKDLLLSDKNAGGMWSRVLWQHAKECALASRLIAERVGYPDPEEAFVGGMLHDMGKLVILLKQRNLFQQIRKLQSGENLSSIDAEKFVLGFSHPEIGGLLMEKWQMPEILKSCVQYHHQPNVAPVDDQLSKIIAYGNCLSNLLGLNEPVGVDKYTENLRAIRGYFNMEEEEAEAFEQKIVETFKQADVFD
jgi:HD-like signal output (HDOD) protein